MESLRISLIQTQIFWEDSRANLESLSKKIDQISKADIIVLAEMFNTGFSMNQTVLAQTMDGEAIKWMVHHAKEKKSAICGSLIIKENGNYYNRFIWVTPNGELEKYDKRHLFSMAQENEHYTPGKENITINYKGWKIRPLICYDLRFPIWSRNRFNGSNHEYDILLYVANWPKVRKDAWEKLLYARAIENQSYVLGVNGIGEDGNKLEYAGSSAIIDMKGELVSGAFDANEKIIELDLNYRELQNFRKKFPVLKDADYFELGE
jgi:predicted amidohydrolase